MIFCPNCKQQKCELLKDRNGEIYQLEDDLNNWGSQKIILFCILLIFVRFVEIFSQ